MIRSRSLVQVHPPAVPLAELSVYDKRSESGPGESMFRGRLSKERDASMLEGGDGLRNAEGSERRRTGRHALHQHRFHVTYTRYPLGG